MPGVVAPDPGVVRRDLLGLSAGERSRFERFLFRETSIFLALGDLMLVKSMAVTIGVSD